MKEAFWSARLWWKTRPSFQFERVQSNELQDNLFIVVHCCRIYSAFRITTLSVLGKTFFMIYFVSSWVVGLFCQQPKSYFDITFIKSSNLKRDQSETKVLKCFVLWNETFIFYYNNNNMMVHLANYFDWLIELRWSMREKHLPIVIVRVKTTCITNKQCFKKQKNKSYYFLFTSNLLILLEDHLRPNKVFFYHLTINKLIQY